MGYFSDFNGLKKIIAFMPGNVYWKKSNGEYEGCNLNQLKVAGLNSLHEIIGKTDYDLYGEVIAATVQAIDKEVMASRQEKEFEEIGVDSKGNKTIYLTKKIPLIDDAENCLGVLGISLDITQRKKLEEEIKQEKEDAIKLKKQAESANELKTQFIQNMQHDVRTPLIGIQQYLEYLQTEESDAEKKEMAGMMFASVTQLLKMCNELVDFENIDYLGNELNLETTNIQQFVASVVDLNKMAAYSRGLELISDIDTTLPPFLKLDTKKLFRVLINLIGNALKFTDAGIVKLLIKKIAKTANTVTVAFEIYDTGMGIPKDKIELIFEKFVRLTAASQAKYKGSGLGLSYVKKFVDVMGGKLEVESEIGKGSVFRVILDLAIPTEEEQKNADCYYNSFDKDSIKNEIGKFPDERFQTSLLPTQPALVKTHENVSSSSFNILIIEDDPMLQKIITRKFATCGVSVRKVVDSVPAACAAIKEHAYDLIVSDLGILQGTGIDVKNWANADKTHPNQQTPFIALTAHTDDSTRQRVFASGFSDMFAKPLEDAMAEKIVDKYLRKIDEKKAVSSSNVIHIQESLNIMGDREMLREYFSMLQQGLVEDKYILQELYNKNDILATRDILHRLSGTLSYSVIPALQSSLRALHEAIRETDNLTKLNTFYDALYREIENYLSAYSQLKQDSIL